MLGFSGLGAYCRKIAEPVKQNRVALSRGSRGRYMINSHSPHTRCRSLRCVGGVLDTVRCPSSVCWTLFCGVLDTVLGVSMQIFGHDLVCSCRMLDKFISVLVLVKAQSIHDESERPAHSVEVLVLAVY